MHVSSEECRQHKRPREQTRSLGDSTLLFVISSNRQTRRLVGEQQSSYSTQIVRDVVSVSELPVLMAHRCDAVHVVSPMPIAESTCLEAKVK